MHGLVAYGHSWVGGAGASSSSCSFLELAARRLGCTAVNLGLGGSLSTDTADLLSRSPAPPARLYLVMTGLNDARLHGGSSVALHSYGGALETIFTSLEAAKPAARVVAVEQPDLVNYSLHAPHDRGSHQILAAYNDQLRTVARRHRRVDVGTVAGWDAATMLDDDTVHPNDAGHAELAGAVVRAAVFTSPSRG